MDAMVGLQMSQPMPRPCFFEHFIERCELADAHQVEQLLARIAEVLAEIVGDRDAPARQLRLARPA